MHTKPCISRASAALSRRGLERSSSSPRHSGQGEEHVVRRRASTMTRTVAAKPERVATQRRTGGADDAVRRAAEPRRRTVAPRGDHGPGWSQRPCRGRCARLQARRSTTTSRDWGLPPETGRPTLNQFFFGVLVREVLIREIGTGEDCQYASGPTEPDNVLPCLS